MIKILFQVLHDLLEWFELKYPNDIIELLNLVLDGMNLSMLSLKKCNSTPVLIHEYISLVYERFYLAESTKHLLQYMETYEKIDIPNVTELRDMSEAYEPIEREARMAQRSPSCLKDNHTEYSADAMDGDSLSPSSNQNNGSVGLEGNGASYHSPPTLRNPLGRFSRDSSVLTTRCSEPAVSLCI